MSEFENMTNTAICIKRNAFKRELYLNGESNSDLHNRHLQKRINEFQAEIDRRERDK